MIENGEGLLNLCKWAQQHDYYLCTMVASDERLLEDNVFKIYYILSGPQGELVILENPLQMHSIRPSLHQSEKYFLPLCL